MVAQETEHAEMNILECKDFLVSGEKFKLVPVAETDILRTYPVPENLSSYYQSEDYISHTDSKSGVTNKIYQLVKRYMLNQKLNWISQFKSTGKLLDVGAGTGDFLLSAKKRGWEVSGVEPTRSARELALLKNLNLHDSISKLENEQFDVISLWHVLEHIPDLENEISRLNELLKKDGILVIAVPNFKSHDAKYYKEFWAAYDVPRHLWHFSQTGIKDLFSQFDLNLISTKALVFDAYYVSLLSEKNKTGSSNFLKALYRGWVSNNRAKTTSEYSSLVYFFQK